MTSPSEALSCGDASAPLLYPRRAGPGKTAARRRLRAATALLLCASVAATTANARDAAPNGGGPVVLVLGDSLSAAYGMATERGWVALAARHEALRRARWINASASGETTAGALRRVSDLLGRHRPDAVVVELGGNDGLRGYPIAQMRDNLERIVRAAQAQGAATLLLGMRIPPNYGLRYARRFASAYQEVAEATGTALLPFFLEGVATDPALMQDDGIHPAAAAQAKMLRHALAALVALVDAVATKTP